MRVNEEVESSHNSDNDVLDDMPESAATTGQNGTSPGQITNQIATAVQPLMNEATNQERQSEREEKAETENQTQGAPLPANRIRSPFPAQSPPNLDMFGPITHQPISTNNNAPRSRQDPDWRTVTANLREEVRRLNQENQRGISQMFEEQKRQLQQAMEQHRNEISAERRQIQAQMQAQQNAINQYNNAMRNERRQTRGQRDRQQERRQSTTNSNGPVAITN